MARYCWTRRMVSAKACARTLIQRFRPTARYAIPSARPMNVVCTMPAGPPHPSRPYHLLVTTHNPQTRARIRRFRQTSARSQVALGGDGMESRRVTRFPPEAPIAPRTGGSRPTLHVILSEAKDQPRIRVLPQAEADPSTSLRMTRCCHSRAGRYL